MHYHVSIFASFPGEKLYPISFLIHISDYWEVDSSQTVTGHCISPFDLCTFSPSSDHGFSLIHAQFLHIKVFYSLFAKLFICCNCIFPVHHVPFKLVYGEADLFVCFSTLKGHFLRSQIQFSLPLWFLEQKEPRFRAVVDL